MTLSRIQITIILSEASVTTHYRQVSKRPSVADLVIEQIKDLVRSGQLRQGDKLPNQNDLAVQLGVSRPSLREAMNYLKRLGIIDQSPGAGTVLLSEQPDLWVEFPEAPVLADMRAMQELVEARRLIETQIVELAAGTITLQETKALDACIKRMRRLIDKGDIQGYLREDVSFHYQLANATRNRYIIHMFVTIRSLMEQFIRIAFNSSHELIENSFDHHQVIVQALQDGDKERAVAEMQRHIGDIKEHMELA